MGSRPASILGPLLFAVLLVGIAWSLVTPPWQAPDENSHFAYVQSLAESGSLPGRRAQDPTFSSEQTAAAAASNADLAAAQRSIKIEWASDSFSRWRGTQARDSTDRADGGGPNPASGNPPLYYLYEVPAYYVASGGDIFARLEALRVWSLLWLLVTVAATWFLAREFFVDQPSLQLLAAGVVGFSPMMLFVSASVSPDSMLYASWAIVLLLGVRLLRHEVTVRRAGLFGAAVGAACVVKATSYALLPGALAAVVLAARPSATNRPTLGAARIWAGAVAGLVLTFGVWLLVSRQLGQSAAPQVSVVTSGGSLNVREFLSYLWQFYLPRTGLQTDFASLAPTLPAWDFLLKGAVASFGWTEVEFDAWVYWIVLACGVIVALGAGTSLWRDRSRADLRVALFLVLIAVALVGGLHVSEYRQLESGALNFFQGRYILPLSPVLGLAVARAALWVPGNRRPSVVGGTLAMLLTFNVFALGLMMTRFYA
jgi:4-amino-4-deoxy-L-arabinose transferase-like glycosyltransferase